MKVITLEWKAAWSCGALPQLLWSAWCGWRPPHSGHGDVGRDSGEGWGGGGEGGALQLPRPLWIQRVKRCGQILVRQGLIKIEPAILSDTFTLACTGKRWWGASQRDCISAWRQSREKYKTSKICSASSRDKKVQDIKTLACCQSVDRPLHRRLPGTAYGNNPHFVSDNEYICQCCQTQQSSNTF